MAATYDPTLPTDKDWVRFLTGDRDVTPESDAKFQDEEILAVLAEEENKYLAAARLAETLLAQSGGAVEKQVDDLRLRWSESPSSAYRQYITGLREKGARLTFIPPSMFRVL
jgi:hypothetical protein